MSWNGSVVTPSSGTIFGWSKCFHITASLQKICGFCQRWWTGKATVSITRLDGLFWTILEIRSHTFDANPRVTEGSLIDITIATRGEWTGIRG